ncbi:MAG: tRNA pseudouridine(38-40) synthase TruA [Saprospiraceae bacterium]|nr:tRNA pseudouridine(38-40) synthase TruA [Saprospiraceae bacterium]
MRYFIECSYDGTPFQGWQKQPGKPTVQESLEQKLGVLLRQKEIDIVGCGRTDTGVHALHYVAHFDFDGVIDPDLVYHWNAILPAEIAVKRIVPVADAAHARFDAQSRTYHYFMHGLKSPFLINKSFFCKRFSHLKLEDLQQAAQGLKAYTSFYPFCLSRSGVNNYTVDLKLLEWKYHNENELIFSITANRFLRGMVRLIVGMCIHVALGQLKESEVIQSLDRQELLIKSWSVPPCGLYLAGVNYPN